MRKASVIMAGTFAWLLLSASVQAGITIATVTVGDPGNVADTRVAGDGTPGFGSVSYTYNIGKYMVTAGQYAAFLNAVAATDTYGVYKTSMSNLGRGANGWGCGITRTGTSGSYSYFAADPNLPVDDPSFWDACRFANWLSNGQPVGKQGASTTETGAYTLTAAGIASNTITRNSGAVWAVASEDEWYKAAYYKGGGADAGYWTYATQTDYMNTTMANYVKSSIVGPGAPLTRVGSYAYGSSYGTYDQSGVLYEWNESVIRGGRGVRGGAYDTDAYYLGAQARGYDYLTGGYVYSNVGFRVVQLGSVPEPSSLIAVAAGLVFLIRMGGVRRRQR